MGRDYYFYAQRREGDAWLAVPEFDSGTYSDIPRSEVTWFDDKDVTAHRLFVGDDAMFPLHREKPPDFDVTKFFPDGPLAPNVTRERQLHWINEAFADWYIGWIGLDELLIDCWSEQKLIVRKHVPIEIAKFFLDGDRPFPHAELITIGWEAHDVESLCDTSHYSYDRRYDPDGYSIVNSPIRWQLAELDSDSLDSTVPVSWTTNIAEFIGEWRMVNFQRLDKMRGDIRIICLFC